MNTGFPKLGHHDLKGWSPVVSHSKSSQSELMSAELNNVWGVALLQHCHVPWLSVQKSQLVILSANHWAGLGSHHQQVCCSSVCFWGNHNVQCHFSMTHPCEPPLLPSQVIIPSAIWDPNICLLAAQPSPPLCETSTAEESAVSVLTEWKQCVRWTTLCQNPASQEFPPMSWKRTVFSRPLCLQEGGAAKLGAAIYSGFLKW